MPAFEACCEFFAEAPPPNGRIAITALWRTTSAPVVAVKSLAIALSVAALADRTRAVLPCRQLAAAIAGKRPPCRRTGLKSGTRLSRCEVDAVSALGQQPNQRGLRAYAEA